MFRVSASPILAFALEGRCRDIREIRLQESCQTSASLSQHTGGWRGGSDKCLEQLEAHILFLDSGSKKVNSLDAK